MRSSGTITAVAAEAAVHRQTRRPDDRPRDLRTGMEVVPARRPAVGAIRCTIAHVGLVVSGSATAAFDDGQVIELKAGELFYIPPEPHDSWVVGDEPYVSLHFLGADA